MLDIHAGRPMRPASARSPLRRLHSGVRTVGSKAPRRGGGSGAEIPADDPRDVLASAHDKASRKRVRVLRLAYTARPIEADKPDQPELGPAIDGRGQAAAGGHVAQRGHTIDVASEEHGYSARQAARTGASGRSKHRGPTEGATRPHQAGGTFAARGHFLDASDICVGRSSNLGP